MATIASRLTANGILYTAGSFDETSISTLRTTVNNIFAAEFDEVNLNITEYNNIALSGGSYLQTPNSTSFGFGTNDYTIEGYFLITDNDNGMPLMDFRTDVYDTKINLWTDVASPLRFYVGGTQVITSDYGLSTNTWYHIAVSRSGSDTRLFVDGIQNGSTYSATDDLGSSNDMVIGTAGDARGNPSYSMNGLVSNIRITKGVALYTSNFTIPSRPLTASSNTSLLLASQLTSDYLVDSSNNNFTITPYGTPTFNPIPAQRQLSTGILQVSGHFDEFTLSQGIITDGLVLYYDISNPSSYTGSNTIIDLSGNGNNGTSYNSPTYNPSNGGSLFLNGIDQHILSDYNLGSNFTVSIIAKMSLGQTQYWATMFGNDVYDSEYGYWMFFESFNNLETGGPLLYNNSEDLYTFLGDSGIYMSNINVYDFVVSGTELSLYVNGTLVNSITTTHVPTPSTSGISFGSRHTNDASGFTDHAKMNLYNAKIYNRALTPSEITQNFIVSGIPITVPSLIFKISSVDSLSSYTDGDPITSIPNLGSGTYTITSSVDSPTKQTVSGYPVINFNTVDQISLLIDTPLDMSVDGSAFVVAWNNPSILVLGGTYTNGTQACFFGWSDALGGEILFRDINDSGLPDGDLLWTPAGGFEVLGIVKTGSTIKIYKNSTSSNTFTGMTGIYQFDQIGKRDEYGGQTSEGYMGDLLFYNYALSDTDAQSVITSLKTKYGIA